MAHPEPEIEKLIEQYRCGDKFLRAIVNTVLAAEGVDGIERLFVKNPELAFELAEDIDNFVVETETIGDFEHDLPRETL